jgi:ADP-ribosyl-[dinitrogen reductase] hydrolase
METKPPNHTDQIAGVLLGTAVGDALGLPREGLSARRAARMYGSPPLRNRLLFGYGMTSDDTEHTCMLAQSLLVDPGEVDRFAVALGWRLRFWLLGMPAGVGLATLRACLKLCIGFPPSHSGVWSAGNGPAMRSALLGVCLRQHPGRIQGFVRASTRITHTDPKAERGALLVALAARHGAIHGATGVDAARFLAEARAAIPDADAELVELLKGIEIHWSRGNDVQEYARSLKQDKGVSGYVYRTVPVVLYGWLRHAGDFRAVLESIIPLGGDADSTGAIAGAITGATVGASGIPQEWIDGLLEWPRSVSWMRRLADRLAEHFPAEGDITPGAPLPLFWPGLPARNVLFLLVVVLLVCRRVLPPY